MDHPRPSVRPTPRYRQIVEAAAELAKELGHEYIGTEHLFLAILGDPAAVPTQAMAEVIEPAIVAARGVYVMERSNSAPERAALETVKNSSPLRRRRSRRAVRVPLGGLQVGFT